MIIFILLAWLLFLTFLLIERRQVLVGTSFVLASSLTIVGVVLQIIRDGGLGSFSYLIVGLVGILILLSLVFGPFLFLGTLFYNSWQLLRREGMRWYNFLSLGLAIALSVYLYLFPRMGNSFQTPNIWYYLYLLVGIWITYAMGLSFSYTVASLLNLVNPFAKPLDYIIVLGAGLNGEEVTPLLASRIDKVIAVYRKNQGSKLIMSGGQGADEVISEAQAMTNYALKQGIPLYDILLENQSTNTKENIRFSVAMMEEDKKQFAIVTNHYHLFRALLFARQEGVKCIGYGAKTKFYFSLNAFIREFIGYLTMSWKWHLVLLGLLTIAYLAIVLSVWKF